MSETNSRRRALAWARSQTWAIERSAFDHLLAIAARESLPDFDAVMARQGERMARTQAVQVREGVAVLDIVGPIFRYANLFTAISGATSIEQASLDLRAALDDPRVRHVVLNIDSPGGAVAGVSDFAKLVAEARKPVAAFVGGMAASAAYWIASAAKLVVISDTAIAGNIGVVATIRTNDDETVVEIVSAQSPNKRPDPRTNAGRAQIQAMVDAVAEVFIAAVAKYRDVPAAKVLNDFGAGGVLVGRQAVRVGMADRIGTLEQIIGAFADPTSAEYRRFVQANDPTPAALGVQERSWDSVVARLNKTKLR